MNKEQLAFTYAKEVNSHLSYVDTYEITKTARVHDSKRDFLAGMEAAQTPQPMETAPKNKEILVKDEKWLWQFAEYSPPINRFCDRRGNTINAQCWLPLP